MLFQLLVIFFVLVQISEQTCRTDDCYSCSLHKDCCITCKCYKSQKFQRTIDTFGCDYKKCDKYDDGKCYSCVDGYYLQNSICYLCTYPCIECQSSKKCKKCSQGYKLSNDKCIQCTVPLCKDCDSNSNQCSQCVNNATYNSSIQECVCNASYFQVSGQCKQCISICGTCSNSYNNCATCKSVSNMSATPINGVCSCVTGYYWNQSNSQCNQCTAPCLTCEDEATQCTSCNGASLTVNDDNQCTCQVGYFSSPNDLYQCEVCSKNCLTCADISNKCTSCYENYELNDGTNSCFCPDGFFEIDNICNKCDSLCSKCSSNSVCTECIDNQFVKFSNQQCTCMDGYYFDAIQSTCLQCDSTCKTCQTQKEMCSSCSLESNRILRVNKCICKPDFFLNVNQLCISCKSKEAIAIEFCKYRDCADGIWSYGEECNDANYSSRDGCYNCLLEPQYYCINEIQKPSQCFKCQEYCSVCEYDYLNKKQVCKQAIDGYYIENSIRINKCGDKCLHCQSNASQCTQCRFLNISKSNINCQLCEYKQGYYTDYENNSCYSKCGDAILADVEQCDDGNRINGDGCSDHCFLEKSFDCLNGVCSKTKNPIPSGQENKIYDLYTPKRQVLVKYDQELSLNQQFDINDQLQIQLNQQVNINYLITTNVDFEAKNLTNFSFTINFEVDRSISNASLLIKYLTPSIFKNAQNQSQEIELIEVKISDFVIISQSVQGLTTATVNSSNYIIYSLIALLGCGLVLGGIDIYFNLIDTLQYLSYLYYINTIFPYNVNQFFENLNFAQFTIVQDYINLDNIFQYDLEYDLEFHSITVPFKIRSQGMYSCFILNFASIFSLFIIGLAFYIVANIIAIKLLASKDELLIQNDSTSNIQLYFLKLQAKFKHFTFQWALITIREFLYSDLLRIFMTTANEYSFTLGLGLKGLDFSSKFGLINSAITFLFLGIYICTTFLSFKIVDQKRFAIKEAQYNIKFGSVFQGLQIAKYQKLYNPLLLIKKFLFMIFLIYLYDQPIIQVLQVTLLSLVTVFFLIFYSPIIDRLELIKQISCEISSFITSLLFTIFCINDLLKFLNEDQKLIIGWVVISNVLTGLFTQLVINTIQQWKYLYYKYEIIRRTVNSCNQRCKSKMQSNQAPHDVFL